MVGESDLPRPRLGESNDGYIIRKTASAVVHVQAVCPRGRPRNPFYSIILLLRRVPECIACSIRHSLRARKLRESVGYN